MDADQPPYNNTHRAFLQAFMARSTMTLEDAKRVLAAIFTARDEDRPTLAADITEADVTSYISSINVELSPLDFEIRSTRTQTADRTWIWAIVNTTSDPLTQVATTRSADEIAFVKRVLDAMFETHNTPRAEIMAITVTQALQLHKAPRNNNHETQLDDSPAPARSTLSMNDAQKCIENLVEEGWFEKSRKGYLSLSPRALMELRGWLVDMYNESPDEDDTEAEATARIRVKSCEACREIVTAGQRCPNRACRCRLHDACVRQIFRGQGGADKKCPVCKQEWTEQTFVGERAARPASRPSGASAASRRSMMGGDSDEDSD
ncbi:DNA repair protein Nse1 [Phyllosticta citrichinensis]|uniref:Non-structural maintenance of chromosomes element 1 homolog n=1 Tax=Phyllosticta citrichinensis TaxID=1130410 RepID=A0ABR1XN45_9PEZI